MKSRTRTVALSVLATLVVLALGGLAYIYSGAYNVAATEDHLALSRWILNTTQTRSVAVRAGEVPEPPAPDSATLVDGFGHYQEMCVVCHGAPGVERGEFGKGITPTPPDLAEEAPGFTSRELFWITKHGIKLAGMPAFGATHSDEELWGIVAFVQRLPEMSGDEYESWREHYGRPTGEPAAAPHTHALSGTEQGDPGAPAAREAEPAPGRAGGSPLPMTRGGGR